MKRNGKPERAAKSANINEMKVMGVTLYPGDRASIEAIKRKFGLTKGTEAVRLALRETAQRIANEA